MKLPWRRNEVPRGQALVEFALVIPIFVFLVMGIFDLGRAVYANNAEYHERQHHDRQQPRFPAQLAGVPDCELPHNAWTQARKVSPRSS